jgi:hypothetical protein
VDFVGRMGGAIPMPDEIEQEARRILGDHAADISAQIHRSTTRNGQPSNA